MGADTSALLSTGTQGKMTARVSNSTYTQFCMRKKKWMHVHFREQNHYVVILKLTLGKTLGKYSA